ncbi:molybdenum cofactor biosynthesis protein [Rhodococcus spelaei]|uniref:Molybdopterin molybdenumtransferase n=1 Tax=Rhodococcus spelaei TaxID=2546320 RepID=A0A541B1D0_9NOCA|nr:NTP transferase domain-containing protein [Rhodococcus spelaei]TQF66102.1 molybdenum cofactor biosynthesis protein [Rhodococcus spelaei]
MSAHTPFDAIVLAGGSASRMGGVDKPSIEVGGRSMLHTALDAVAAADRVVVVGPHRDDLDPTIRQTQESPHGAGPVSALAAGLREVSADLVVTLAADLPFLTPSTIERLLAALAAEPAADAAFATDETGRVQFLLGLWRTGALTARLDALEPDGLVNRAMKSLVPKNHVTVQMSGISDCDTEADVAAARARTAAAPMTITQARRAIRDDIPPLATRVLPPTLALDSVLAESLIAAAPFPRFDVSAMDGYAVSGSGPWQLDTAIRYAGSEEDLTLTPGHAVRIATGAHVPPGSTSVVRDEHVELAGTTVSRRPDVPVRDDTRRSGEDWRPGALLATAGARVTPAVASVALSGEVAALTVRGPVRAHVVVTGDEIRRDGPLREGQTRDSVGPLLPQFLSWCGVRTATESHLRDTAGGFDELLGQPAAATGADAELIVIVGATGGGAADHMRLALQRRGARTIVGRVQVRPGGSQVVASLPDGRIVLGLPGNPYAAVATLLLTAPAVVAALTGEPSPVPTTGVVANAAQASSDFPRIVPVTRMPDGRWHAAGHVRTAHLAALVGAQALAVIEPATPDDGIAELLPLR